ncbi:Forkhead box protein O [Trichinella pseudospiralis]|uniref:Forkhead box protein O n=2 Tax=Trichinella pseudospiralis TaxID=6337 RepID=A0A0V1JHH9_TRIPS|nr:Forkhead box protein O [Trichinella pseudospiralis]
MAISTIELYDNLTFALMGGSRDEQSQPTVLIRYSNGAQVRCELSSSDGNFSSESVAQSAGSCVAVCVALERLSWLFGWACRFVQSGVASCGAHSMTSTSASSSTSSGRGDDLLRATLGDPFLKSKITCNVSSPVPDGDDFDPQPRDRCNSWPLQKAHGEFAHHTSPLIHEEIPEEGSDTGSNQDLPASRVPVHGSSEILGSTLSANPSSSVGEFPPGKRSSSRRNAWGNLSYADLITQAILSTPEKRLTLSQIYDWMVKNVPYFRDKGDSNSSAGWKNSIRHNLSLHSRFMRIQNEGPGKSSWWVIDPDAKPGKSSRRRAGSMEISKKLEKKRGRVRKKMEQLRTVNGVVNSSDPAMNTLSPSSESSDLFDSGSMMPFNLSPASDFRHRSNSAVSSYSVGAAGPCLSPKFESRFDDWQDDVPCSADPYPSDLLESMSHSMSLTEPPPYPSAQAAQSFIYGEEEPTSTSRLHNGNNAAAKYVVVSQQQQRGRPIANAFNIKGTTTSQLGATGNGQVVYQQQQQQQHMKNEPPPYRDMYSSPAVSTASQGGLAGNNNRMLRQVLQKSSGASSALLSQNSRPLLMADLAPMRHHQQPQHSVSVQQHIHQQPTMLQQMMQDRHSMHEFSLCSPLLSGSAAAAAAAAAAGHMVNSYTSLPSTTHSNGQLPTELSEMMYDSEIQCDIDQVIRHELNIAGNLDFSVDNFGNI